MPDLVSPLPVSTRTDNPFRYRPYYIVGTLVLVCIVAVFGSLWYLRNLTTRINQEESQNTQIESAVALKTMDGKILFVDERLYPGLEVTHVLRNSAGTVQALLKAEDAILEVAEGHQVTIYGEEDTMVKAKFPVLKVVKVVIKSKSK